LSLYFLGASLDASHLRASILSLALATAKFRKALWTTLTQTEPWQWAG